MILSIKNLAALRRAVALILLGLFMAALLGQSLGLLLLPLLGPSQAGMVLAAYVAGGAGTLVLGILAGHLVLALVFGRAFCSWLCPLGIVQDITARFFARQFSVNSVSGVPGGKNKKQHYHFARSGAVRYILPALLISALFWPFMPPEGQGASGTWLYGLAEPYSIFARSVQSIGQPVQALFVNALAFMGEESSLFLLPRIPYKIDLTGLALAVPILGLVLALVPRGRGYCNSICPVGALLGLIGASAWLRPRFTKDCNSCGLCERRCKARCLDPANKTLDGSRCVTCYNCLESCPRGGLALTPQPVRYMPERALLLRALPFGAWAVLLAPLTRTLIQQSRPPLADAPLPTSTVTGPTEPAPLLPVAPTRHSMPVLPPGALSLAHLESRCTGCHSCLDVCPPGVLTASGPLAWEQRSFARMALPGMDFSRAFCQIGCNRCSTVCPSGALRPVSLEDKKRLQLGQAVFTKSLCVIITAKTRCGACAEHCPTGALRMTPPVDGGMPLPLINQDLCIGCGACEYACPVRPRRSVEVFALAVHAKAAQPRSPAEQQDIKAGEEFPF